MLLQTYVTFLQKPSLTLFSILCLNGHLETRTDALNVNYKLLLRYYYYWKALLEKPGSWAAQSLEYFLCVELP